MSDHSNHSSPSPNSNNYTQGHSKPVVEAHGRRTAAFHASYLLPYLKPNNKILDIGCGPGSITLDFARLVPEGHVVGIDYGEEAVLYAREKAAEQTNVRNVEFTKGDVYDLSAYADGEFDVVHCHQMLLHLNDPVRALKEMRRVCKQGGRIACREADFESFSIYPDLNGLVASLKVWAEMIRVGGGEPNGGRHLLEWGLAAGFRRDELSTGCYPESHITASERHAYGITQAARIEGAHGQKAVSLGLCTKEEQQRQADAWKDFAKPENESCAYFMVSMWGLMVKS